MVKWCEGGRIRFVVVSLNPLDPGPEPIWDALAWFDRKDKALRYVDDVVERVAILEKHGLA